ncbi:hypothetical protein Tco_1039967 [Tanacetum coccineum]
MDDPNITMEEYIRIEEEKARKHRKVFNWETAKYGRIWYDEDIHDLRSIENEFPAITFNDSLKSDMDLPPRDQRNQYLRYEGLQYTNVDIADFKMRLAYDIIEVGCSMEHGDAEESEYGEAILNLDTLGALQFQLGRSRRCLSWRQFIITLRLHTGEEIESLGFARYWAESARQIIDKGDLRDYRIGISSVRDFLGIALSYTVIRDPILRLCHMLIACSIAERSQAPEKVTMTNLFYLRGMDVGSVNVPNLLARYLRLFATGRKSEALISRGQFILMIHGLVAMGPERQLDVFVGAHRATKDSPAIDEDMPQAMPPSART